MRFGSVTVLMALAALQLSACASGQATPRGPNPIAGQQFYLDSNDVAAQQVNEWRLQDKGKDAGILERVSLQPVAAWFTSQTEVKTRVQSLAERAGAAGRSALLVAYYIPNRDCGAFSGGGASSPAAYRQWIEQFAAGIGRTRATVIVEPDAVAQTLSRCLPAGVAAERYSLLSFAVGVLRRNRNTTVYLDAGNPGWIRDLHQLAHVMRLSGIAHAQGFALNISNFYRVPVVTAYGRRLSALLGGKHFVIDTSRNGNGPDTAKGDEPKWCNPPGRALGPNPTTRTGIPLVDGLLWVKQPGSSDGACRPGEPRAGQWWPDYALELARNSKG
jgi:endoglucanase